MNKIFWETITGNMRLVLNDFLQTRIGAGFYLAGGTALSLQLGHRRSVDLDFFSPTEDVPTIRTALEESLSAYQPTLSDSAWGNLVYLVQGVRVGFYGYGFPLVAPLIQVENIRLLLLKISP